MKARLPRWLCSLAVAVAVAGCDLLGPQFDAVARRPLEPVPAQYIEWYIEVQDCLDRKRDFGRIEWFVAQELYLDDVEKGGVWSPPIRITMRVDHILDQRAVKHEMIHYIEQRGGHTPDFLRCSGAVQGRR